MLAPGDVILTLKVAVATVTLLLVASLVALAAGRPRWHGRLNTVFFALTAATVLGFEVVIRLVRPDLTAGFTPEQREALSVHLGFALPAAVLLPAMLFTGRRRYKSVHRALAVVFLVLWAGTFVTGVFFLPHSFDPTP
jgi:Ni/Fe-hydrogenase subunit HybB-like protein